MPLFTAPILISSFIVLVLGVLGGFKLVKRARRRGHLGSGVKCVFEFKEKVSLEELIKRLGCPFVLEVVTHHLGKGARYYLEAPARKAGVLKNMGAEEAEEYSVCGVEQVYMGVYFTAGKEELRLADLDLGQIDFSKVNEVGEGVVIQFVFENKKKSACAVNVRGLVSAPSQFQGKEILTGLKKSMAGLKAVEVKSEEFIARVCSREFYPQEELYLYT